jgi:lysozyme family protein
MKENWSAAFDHMLESEGGFVDDPLDRGGTTMLGVTQKTWEDWLKRPVTKDEMRALTKEQVEPLYKTRYWDAIKGDQLPDGVDYLVFDFAVNAGPGRAAKFLQKAVGANPDGAIGPATLAAVAAKNPLEVIEMFSTVKSEFYHGLVESDATQQRFLQGWLNRVASVKQHATELTA